jgi:hypothetical protein
MEKLFFDTECYPNYFLIMLKNEAGKIASFEVTNDQIMVPEKFYRVINNKQLIGFNSKMYDIPMIAYALTGANNLALKQMSNLLIQDKELLKKGLVKSSFEIISENSLWGFDKQKVKYDHIDIKPVVGKYSLKLYGARAGSKKLQDLPYNHLEPLSYEQMLDVKNYCLNDVNITIDLFNIRRPELTVRENLNKEYNVDSRSMSDSRIADLVFSKFCKFESSELKNLHIFKFKTNLDFKFKSDDLVKLKSDLNNIEFKVKRYEKTKIDNVHRTININNTPYKFGVGGLHSCEKNRAIICDNDEWLIDVDVSSCYPKIILNNNLYPNQSKEGFLDLYREIYNERIEAKKNKDKTRSDVLKIVLNGSFGKFKDSYSKYLYSPELLITTTITGQLGLLLLIERLEEYGFNVISANTDGITARVKKDKYNAFNKIVKAWETKFDYETEEVKYKALYNHSVNSYIAVKEDGSLKLKGQFAENDLSRNIDVPLCKKAVIACLTKGIKIEDTILNLKTYLTDPNDFIKIRKTKFGGYWRGKYLGHTVRWYWSIDGEAITNSKGHKIAETNDAYPIMDLGDRIKDLHYEKYIKKSYELLKLVGVNV